MVQANFTIHTKDKNLLRKLSQVLQQLGGRVYEFCLRFWNHCIRNTLGEEAVLHLLSELGLTAWTPNRMEGSKPSGGTSENNNVAEN